MPNIPRSILRRRRFLQSGGIVALGALSTALAGRKFFTAPPSSAPVASVPRPLEFAPRPHRGELAQASAGNSAAEAPRRKPFRPLSHEDEYAEFLASLDLRHLAPGEIITPHRRVYAGISNELPPKKLWERLAPTLRVADELRERLGVPLQRITSAYRAPQYNIKIPGAAANSYHTRNQALDLVFGCSAREAIAMAQQLRRERYFRGGIGIYPSFIHIDTRGYNATWRG